jgi:LysR family transcriptional regulator (chromosome initiation inhibitor)
MLDYKGLEALFFVIKESSFEQAAKQLHISQSAVSQRIKALQADYADQLIIKETPYKPTPMGEQLLAHYHHVHYLEQQIAQKTRTLYSSAPLTLVINQDSLETWFGALLTTTNIIETYNLNIITDDQDHTHELIKSGKAHMSIGTQSTPSSHCSADKLGSLRYYAVASPRFAKHHFTTKSIEHSFIQAPTLIYDTKDRLLTHFLQHHFSVTTPPQITYLIPSVNYFKQLVLQGIAYALIPHADIIDELETGELINLCPDRFYDMPLYLHSWKFADKRYNNLITLIKQAAEHIL